MNKENLKKLKESIPSDRIGLMIALVIIVGVFSYFNRYYFSATNFINILVAASLIGLVAIGETYLVIAGLVDLSAGSVAAFASVLSAVLLINGVPFILTIILVMIAGMIVGVFNGFFVNQLQLEPFIATLASMSIMRGIAYIICGGKPKFIVNETFIKMGNYRLLGIPIPVYILIIGFIIFGIILAKTRFGRSIYVIGGNKTAARLAGLNPKRITIILYMISGALAALGGSLLAARMSSGQPSASVGLEFDAITAAVLGGTAFSGGVGTIFGTVLGVLILQGFNTGLIMLSVPVFWQYVARGMLLLIALAFDYYRKKVRNRKLLQESMAI
ncbi:ABC transporter permease [Vallitalea pronyensis]|uniref:ABC transporter permease n=1 Tax=Vallitalea pronyensis TaxID=1348613 RepID=A0A8J8SII9_9FIRM|nr:ABC transporter permease [Vallitalea pronyensis]QUI24492.1 ABC transporter permease [Vallitalea pronyensis]